MPLKADYELRLDTLSTPQDIEPPFTILAFEGCGMKSIVYPRVIQGLEKRGLMQDVEHVAGSSAGGIMAVLISLGFSGLDIENIFKSDVLNFKGFKDSREEQDWLRDHLGFPASNLYYLITRGGVFKGDAFQAATEKMIAQKLEESLGEHLETVYQALGHRDLSRITFGQLKALRESYPECNFKLPHLTGTRMMDGHLKVFSHESEPDMAIADALRITVSYPGMFETPKYEGRFYGDGGITKNFPVELFNREPYLTHGLKNGMNPCVLGFLVETTKEMQEKQYKEIKIIGSVDPVTVFKEYLLGPFHYFHTVITEFLHSRTEEVRGNPNAVQIYDMGLSTMNFDLTDQEKEMALESGRRAIDSFFIQKESEKDNRSVKKTSDNLYHRYYTMNVAQLRQALKSIEKLSNDIENDIQNDKSLNHDYESVRRLCDEHMSIARERANTLGLLNKTETALTKSSSVTKSKASWFERLSKSVINLLPLIEPLALTVVASYMNQVSLFRGMIHIFAFKTVLRSIGDIYKGTKRFFAIRESEPSWTKIQEDTPRDNRQDELAAFLKETTESARLKRTRPPVENIVFNSTGLQASTLYLGVLKALETEGHLNGVKRVASSSLPGIIATLWAAGIDLTDIEVEFLKDPDFMDHHFKYDPTLLQFKGHRLGVSSIAGLLNHKSLYKTDALKEKVSHMLSEGLRKSLKTLIWRDMKSDLKYRIVESYNRDDQAGLERYIDRALERIADKLLNKKGILSLGNITFGQLHALGASFPKLNIKDLYLGATRMSDGSLRVFSHETDPTMPVMDALCMSLSMPGIFEPIRYEDDNYIDGAIAERDFGVDLFDKEPYLSYGLNQGHVNPCTLFIRADSDEQINAHWGDFSQEMEAFELGGFVHGILQGMLNRSERLFKRQPQILQIPKGKESDMGLSLDAGTSKELIKVGELFARRYLKHYTGDDILYDPRCKFSDLCHKICAQNPASLDRTEQEIVFNFERLRALSCQKISDSDRKTLEENLKTLGQELKILREYRQIIS